MFFSAVRSVSKKLLIAINLLMSACLLLACYGKYANPVNGWFMGLFTLAAFYFLVALIVFLLFWLIAKPAFSFISLLTIVGCWQPLQEMVQLRLTAPFNNTKNPSCLRVMSWNVEHFDILEHKTHPNRKKEMIALINKYAPDVACFQEVVAGENPKAINNIDSLMQHMGFNYVHYSYNKKLDFDDKHHFGLAIFSKHPLINKQTISFTPNDYNSIFQFADVVIKKDTIRVYNIHMQSLKLTENNRLYIENPAFKNESDFNNSKNVISKLKHGFIKRSVQSNRIKQSMNTSVFPVIACGDFNDVPNSYAYYTIGKNMQNAFTQKGGGIGRTFFSVSPTLRIDHIFCPQNFTVMQYTCIRKKLSDHYPIISDLQYPHTQ